MRKSTRVLVVVLFAVVAFAGWRTFGPPAGITRRGFELIQVGMTQREVEAILGRPPGEYPDPGDTPPDPASRDWSPVWVAPQPESLGYRQELWFVPGRAIYVYFWPDGTVADKGLLDVNGTPLPWLDRLRGWLGW
jgi:hypothetical protein